MEAAKKPRERQTKNEHASDSRRRAINQLAIGSIIFLWGSLVILKQAGIISKNVSTWSLPLATFGMLLVIGGIFRLSRLRTNASQE